MNCRCALDLHTHTIASGHAYCTLREMAQAASNKWVELSEITEHTPKISERCTNFYF